MKTLQYLKIKLLDAYDKIRKKRETKLNEKLKYEFLSSNLEIIERPTSKIGKNIIYTIFVILLTAIIWATFSQVDEIASARGKIIPYGKIKILQSMNDGIITGIYATEGEKVEKGQKLLETDITMQENDKEKIIQNLNILEIEQKLLKQTLNGTDMTQELKNYPEISKEVKNNIQQYNLLKNTSTEEQKEILKGKINQAKNNIKEQQAELKKLQRTKETAKIKEQEMEKLNKMTKPEEIELKIIQKQIETYKKEIDIQKTLYDVGAVAEADLTKAETMLDITEKQYAVKLAESYKAQNASLINYQNAKNETAEITDAIEIQKIKITQAEETLKQTEKELKNYDTQNKTQLLNLIVEKDKEKERLKKDIEQADTILSRQTLKSPVKGTVQGISEKTVGGVISKAETVITIVPDDTPLIIEAYIENKDIGFIRKGQEVRIKLDAYSYQKYGTIDGVITKISPDAYEDEKMGLVYKVNIEMKQKTIKTENETHNLTAGMAVTAEIKTGKRRIIEYITEPITESIDETIHLR